MNTDYVSVDQGRVAALREEGAGGHGRDDDNVGGRDPDPGPIVGEGGFDEVVCGAGVDGVTDSRGIRRPEGTAGGRDPGPVVREGGLNEVVYGIGRVDRADGGRDPGLAVGEGVHSEAVGGAGVDGVEGHDNGFVDDSKDHGQLATWLEAGAGGRGSEHVGVGSVGGEE